MKKFLLILTFLSLCFIAIGQRAFSIEEVIYVKKTYKKNRGTFKVLLPESQRNAQDLVDLKFSIAPNTFAKENGSLYAVWDLKGLKKNDSIIIKTDVVLKRNDLFTALNSDRKPTILLYEEKYLRAERNIQTRDRKLIQVATKLKGTDRYETVENIFSYVGDHLEYHHFKNKNRGAKQTYRDAKGYCTEYSELMVTLCRINNIPSRIVNGKTLNISGRVVLHNWVDVYFDHIGWVAFDPTYADSPYGVTSFKKMRNYYLAYSYNRYDKFVKWKYDDPFSNLKAEVKQSWNDEFWNKYAPINKLIIGEDWKERIDISLIKLDSLAIEYPNNIILVCTQIRLYIESQQFDKALSCLQRGMKNCYFEKDKGRIHYFFAVFHASQNEFDLAFQHLEKAHFYKWHLDILKHDKAFDSMKKDPKYQEALNQFAN